MKLIEYIILAVIQGLTEPLPISSSGHMYLFKNLFNTNIFNNMNYEIICNFGSFLAILIIFWKDIIIFIKDFFTFIFNKEKRKETKKGFLYCIYIVVSTIPITITGLFFKEFAEAKFTNMIFLGVAFLLTSISLFLVKNIKGKKDDFDITLKDAIIIGFFQAVTIFPGISRSGTVLVACLLCNLSRNSALKYTFICYFPVSIGSLILGTADLINTPNISSLIFPFALGLIISGVITYLTYSWLNNWVKKGKMIYFSIYCLMLSIFIFIFFR